MNLWKRLYFSAALLALVFLLESLLPLEML